MRTLTLLFASLIAAPACADRNDPRFLEYQQRRQDRWEYAMQAKYHLNSGKVHRYRTAVRVQVVPMLYPPMIQQGLIRWPHRPVYVRPFPTFYDVPRL